MPTLQTQRTATKFVRTGLRAALCVDCVWNVMAHAQKPDFVFRRNGRVHLNRRGASVQSTTGSRGVRISSSNAGYTTFRGSVRVLATHSIRQFPLHFSNLASPCAITFQLDATHEIGQGCPTSDQSSCVRDPPPQRYIIYTLPKIAQKFSRLRIPLTIIFTSAAPIPAQKMVLPRHPSEENPTWNKKTEG